MEEQDRIKINDLSVRAIIGTEDYERETRQELLLNLTLFTDVKKAGKTDELQYTVDYSQLKEKIVEMIDQSNFQLIEALAEEIARIALSYERVEKVKVTVGKPGALNLASSAEVQIVRESSQRTRSIGE